MDGSGRGETIDATFVWLPSRRILANGDVFICMFPGAGYPAEGAASRGKMGRHLALMNRGATLDQMLHAVTAPTSH
jgi:hypothetical protein